MAIDIYEHLHYASDNLGCPSLICIDCEIRNERGTFLQASYESLTEALNVSKYYFDNYSELYFVYKCDVCCESEIGQNIYHLCLNPEGKKLATYI